MEIVALRSNHHFGKVILKTILLAKKTADMIKLIAFKQKAGMMPKDYIERYDHAWKD